MMRRGIVLTIVLGLGVVAQAQNEQRSRTEIENEERLRTICAQLDLTDEQAENVEPLIQIYKVQAAEQRRNPAELLARVQQYYGEYEDAKARGDEEGMAEAREKMRLATPGALPAQQFFENLEQYLTEAQKAKLEELRRQPAPAQRTPVPQPQNQQADPTQARQISGDAAQRELATRQPTQPMPTPEATGESQPSKLRPFHVVKTAKSLGLSGEQVRELEGLMAAFRTQVRNSPPADPTASEAMVNGFAEQVREVLTQLQVVAFNQQIETLRTSAPDPEVIQVQGNMQGRPNPRGMPTMPQRPGQP